MVRTSLPIMHASRHWGTSSVVVVVSFVCSVVSQVKKEGHKHPVVCFPLRLQPTDFSFLLLFWILALL